MSLEYFIAVDDLSYRIGKLLALHDLENHGVQVSVLDESTGQHVFNGPVAQAQDFINTIGVPDLYSMQVNLVELSNIGLIDNSWLPSPSFQENVKVEKGRTFVTRSPHGWFIYYLSYPQSQKVLAIIDEQLCQKIDQLAQLEEEDPGDNDLGGLFSKVERSISETAWKHAQLKATDRDDLSYSSRQTDYRTSASNLYKSINQMAQFVLLQLSLETF